MTAVDDTTGAEASATGRHPALDDLFRYPLLSALTERRTRRIPRGFSVKFYTEEGNWDIVGNVSRKPLPRRPPI